MIQSAGPSPALLDRLKNAADLMGIKEEGEEKDSVELSASPRIDRRAQSQSADAESRKHKDKTRRASYLWAMLIARIYEALPLLCPRCGHATGILRHHISEMENHKRPIGKKNARLLAKTLDVSYKVFL